MRALLIFAMLMPPPAIAWEYGDAAYHWRAFGPNTVVKSMTHKYSFFEVMFFDNVECQPFYSLTTYVGKEKAWAATQGDYDNPAGVATDFRVRVDKRNIYQVDALMTYTPEGMEAVWTYLPEELENQLKYGNELRTRKLTESGNQQLDRFSLKDSRAAINAARQACQRKRNNNQYFKGDEPAVEWTPDDEYF